NGDFNQFNRAEFIRIYCNPVTSAIAELEQKLQIHIIRYNRLLNQDAKTLFDTNAFNVNAYAPDEYAFLTSAKILLGERLFKDPSFSGTGTRSCESCHQPEKAFSDGLVKNTILGGQGELPRNTPSLLNAALQPALFYDLRVRTLEDQSRAVVQSAEEMHGSMQLSIEKLWRDTSYRRMFLEAFPKKNRNSIDTLEVMNAIASYVRSLVKLNSRFDEYMRGSKDAMNETEVEGFNLFMGKAKCGTCHYMPLFNGAFPPRYIYMESEVIGVPKSIKSQEIDPDPGRYNIQRTASFMHAFKTPTLREVSKTAPYMHNGIFNTLKEVLDFYNTGGGI
ncbi:MAG TPA: cytochrome c peroxidase, partial [Puia sp.]|nr:cytochrome c peroxidase [Puia sp.]